MHDVWEGVAQYDLASILNNFVNVKKYFSLSRMNNRINGFKFQNWENKPTEINSNRLKTKLKLSAAETMSLTRNFTHLLGDLVPEDDPFWDLFLKLKAVTDLKMSNIHTKNTYQYIFISFN